VDGWARYGVGHFFDLVEDKTIDGLDPANVVTIMTSPLSGTLVPGASSRTEVQGIGVQSYPIGWFTRSNFGGRFSSMLKFAGWDGVVIKGKSDIPVWIDIRNKIVTIKDCKSLSLWGMDTRKCQETIWDHVAPDGYGDWISPAIEGEGQTTQRPAVLAIGPSGENLSRLACLIHDTSSAAGQGGFGAVWGSKNLKAISVIGTGSIRVHDPKALIATRLWQKKNYAFDMDNLKDTGAVWQFQTPPSSGGERSGSHHGDKRPKACVGCHSGCRAIYDDGVANESTCIGALFYMDAKTPEIQRKACELINVYALNAAEMIYGLLYIRFLSGAEEFGVGQMPNCPLDFSDYGSFEFIEQFVRMVAYGDDGKGNESQFGKDISNGFVRASKKWGRLEKDLRSGLLHFPYWGLPLHKEPRAQVYWGYGTLLGDRDINEHDFDWLHWQPTNAKLAGRRMKIDAEEAVGIYTRKMVPFQDDPLMLDYSTENMYSPHIAKLASWHRYYTRFWKQSALFCDWRWPDFINVHAPDNTGSTGQAEPMFLKAVTGKDFSFLDGIELGRRIWNLDHAIWTLQGRHRDMVHFAEFIYRKPAYGSDGPVHCLPGRVNGEWQYIDTVGRRIDKQKFEGFKTAFYKLQGWDETSGYPTRSTLESLSLGHVADELDKNDRLGRG
jgi:aldehyde:ferredoxin oxidoreductase